MKKMRFITILMSLVWACLSGFAKDMTISGIDFIDEYYERVHKSARIDSAFMLQLSDYDFSPDVFGTYDGDSSGDFHLHPKYAVLGEDFRRMDLLISCVSHMQPDGSKLVARFCLYQHSPEGKFDVTARIDGVYEAEIYIKDGIAYAKSDPVMSGIRLYFKGE